MGVSEIGEVVIHVMMLVLLFPIMMMKKKVMMIFGFLLSQIEIEANGVVKLRSVTVKE